MREFGLVRPGIHHLENVVSGIYIARQVRETDLVVRPSLFGTVKEQTHSDEDSCAKDVEFKDGGYGDVHLVRNFKPGENS